MAISTDVRLKGIVQIDVRDRGGRLVERREVSNLIVDSGLDLLSRLMISAFLNDAAENVQVRPVQAIAVGNDSIPAGGIEPVDPKSKALGQEWGRQRIEQVELLRASLDIADAADGSLSALRFTSRIQGAYGNRIRIRVLAADASNKYRIEVEDGNTPVWMGSGWAPGPTDVRVYAANDLNTLLADMTSDPTVQAFAPDLSWSGELAADSVGTFLAGGGRGVVVSTTFTSTAPDPVGLTEAALFTSDDPGDSNGIMFNMVRFPVINISSDLDITFRWKLTFQEGTAAS